MEATEEKRVSLASLAFLVIILAGVKIATPIIVPFLLSLFLVIITKPFSDALHAKGLPTWLVFTLILAVISLFNFLLVVIISNAVSSFANNMDFYNQKLLVYGNWISGHAEKLGIQNTQELKHLLDPEKIMGFVSGALSSFSDILSNVILILLTVVFIFLETKILPDKIKAISRDGRKGEYFRTINHQINQYMMIHTYVSLGTGIIIGGLLAIIGLDYAILWGMVAFLLNYIPNIGSLIAAIPPIILALVQFGVGGAIGVTIIFLAVNFIIGNYIEPRLLGRGLGLSVLVVFLSLIFWGWLLGPVGMFLSIPITLVFKIILGIHPDTRWIAVLLGDGTDTYEPEDIPDIT